MKEILPLSNPYDDVQQAYCAIPKFDTSELYFDLSQHTEDVELLGYFGHNDFMKNLKNSS